MRGVRLTRILGAAAAYATIVFGVGFVLGTARTLVVAPRIGAFAAVCMELPLILTASWFVCGRVLNRFHVPADRVGRSIMALLAFAVAMALEFGFAALVFGAPPAAYLRSILTAAGLLGLAGQLAFAVFPIMRSNRDV